MIANINEELLIKMLSLIQLYPSNLESNRGSDDCVNDIMELIDFLGDDDKDHMISMFVIGSVSHLEMLKDLCSIYMDQDTEYAPYFDEDLFKRMVQDSIDNGGGSSLIDPAVNNFDDIRSYALTNRVVFKGSGPLNGLTDYELALVLSNQLVGSIKTQVYSHDFDVDRVLYCINLIKLPRDYLYRLSQQSFSSVQFEIKLMNYMNKIQC